jgi:hypothetical protein
LKIRFRIDINFKSDFETEDFFRKWSEMIFERFQWSLGFEYESNSDLKESGHFLLAHINLKQYTSTKINA